MKLALNLILPLYLTFGSLQALDARSTWRALDGGAAEANPVVAPFAGNKPALITAKVVGTAGVIAISERLRRQHPRAALWLMVGLNSGMLMVVEHNLRR